MSYYWGVKDTSVSFCEEGYKESKYIAEYYNTITGAFYIIVGLPFLNTEINNIAIANIYANRPKVKVRTKTKRTS